MSYCTVTVTWLTARDHTPYPGSCPRCAPGPAPPAAPAETRLPEAKRTFRARFLRGMLYSAAWGGAGGQEQRRDLKG